MGGERTMGGAETRQAASLRRILIPTENLIIAARNLIICTENLMIGNVKIDCARRIAPPYCH